MTKQERLQKLIDYYSNGNKSQFAKFIGTSPQNISTWLARGTYNKEQILTKCVNINAEWLMTGEGPMLKEDAPEKIAKEQPTDYNRIINELLAIIHTQNVQLERATQRFDDASKNYDRALTVIEKLINKKSPTTRYMVAEDIENDE